MPTGLIHDLRFCLHDTGAGHPERPDRLRAIDQRLRDDGLPDQLTTLMFEPASVEDIRLVHDQPYADRLAQQCARGGRFIDEPDSAICPESYDIALLATGGALAAADAVMAGQVQNAFAALRPPGHHAESHQSMGFCLFNNIAVIAEHLIQRHGLERIAIVDFDVHHGNGTQHTFEARRDVLFISIHEDPRYLYPGSGFADETGRNEGEGHTLNLPMPPRSDDRDYQTAFEQKLIPRLTDYEPQALLVSAGFDAAAADPLAHIELSTECFAWMTRQLTAVAATHCRGRLICTLEGGYDLTALADGVAAVLKGLLEAG